MKSFVIKRIDKELELNEPLWVIKGFKYVPKIKNKLRVSEMTIVNPEIIYALVAANFNKKYKKILELYLLILQNDDEDAAEGYLMRALDEIAKLRSIIIRKYEKLLKKRDIEKFLKRLKIIENELRSKIIDFKLMQEIKKQVPEKEKSR